MVAAFVLKMFAQPDADAARRPLLEAATRLGRSLPKAAIALADAEDDVTAYAIFFYNYWSKVWSTHPLERLKKETKRSTYSVDTFPNDDALL